MRSLLALVLLFPVLAFAQTQPQTQAPTQTPSEDSTQSLNAKNKTQIGGYGEARVSFDVTLKDAHANLDRAVIFVGHRFSKPISFFSELEVEDAKVAGGEVGGEVAFEQAYLKFDISKSHFITAGLILPRIGIINENHLPTTFNGVDRPFVEQYIIPATWREIGVSWYGTLASAGGLQYSLAVLNGLNAAGFGTESELDGIRGGRYEGRDASLRNMAVTGSLVYPYKGLRLQVSYYYGGTVSKTTSAFDSTAGVKTTLQGGTFGTPVALAEADAQYDWQALHLRALATNLSLADAKKIYAVLGNAPVSNAFGYYGEAAVDILYGVYQNDKKLNVFVRYEQLRFDKSYPSTWSVLSITRSYIVTGFVFSPTNGVVVKLDYVYNRNSRGVAFVLPKESVINVGIGYSF